MKKNTALTCCLLLLSFIVKAQPENRLMFLGKPEVIQANLSEFIAKENVSSTEIFNGYYYRFVQFNNIPSQENKIAMEQSGLVILDYMPHKAYMVAIPQNYNRALLASFDVRCVVKQNAEQKKSKNLFGDAPAHAVNEKGFVDVRVQYQKNIPFSLALAQATSFGKILDSKELNRMIELRVANSGIRSLAEQPWLYFIDVTAPPSVKEDVRGRSLHRSNAINSDLIMGRHYNGSGVGAALADDGIVGPHIDFTGRITNHATATGGSHGDMTGGILAGAGNLDPSIRGMADGVDLHVFDIGAYPQILDAVANNINFGTVVSSTSYSQGCNEYTSDTQFGDQTLYDNNQLEFVFSAGNNNGADCGYGAGGNWGNITGGYKQGKNVIACANLDALEVIDPSSSIGPAADGRIKPDISANGRDQLSTAEGNTYQVGGGTSAACPGVAGICTQLIQAYKELYSAANAPTALIKACLLNGAEDIGNPGPDFKFGWGRVNALRAVKTLEDNRFTTGSMIQGAATSFNITVPANVIEMRVMLYWHDVGGTPGAAISLVNDLDLTVTDPASTVWSPWVLDPTPNAVSLNSNATRGADHLNNMEQVTISAPAAGSYVVNIAGFSVPQGPQTYYLVYEFRTDDITVTYPMGGEGFVPGEDEIIRWDAVKGLGSFSLNYSVDNGANWNFLATGVSQNTLQYTWNVPNNLTGEALVRVSRGTVNGISSEKFSIVGTPQNLNVAWACVDSIKLSWANVNGAAWYEVSMLGANYMDSIGITTNTNFVLTGTNPVDEYWFSVRAVMANGSKGRRASAVNKQPGVSNCPNSAPYAQFIASANGGCTSKTILFTDQSANGPSTWLWTFTPNTVTFVNGTTAGSQFPAVQFNATGVYDVTLTVSNSFGSDSAVQASSISILAATLPPIAEDFQMASFPPIAWSIEDAGGSNTWEQKTNIIGSGGTLTNAAFVDNFSYNNQGAEDGLATLEVDLTTATSAILTFDVAYARYSATFSDALRIDVSTNCGNTYAPSGYLKAGAALATVGDQTTIWFPTANSEWRNDTVDMSAFLGQNVLVKFVNINDFGNSLLLDNINIDITTGVEQVLDNTSDNIFVTPNPSSGLFTLNVNSKKSTNTSFSVTDARGKQVILNQKSAGRGKETIDLRGFNKGVYMLSVTTDLKITQIKLVVM